MGPIDTPLPDDCGQPGVQQNLTYMQGWIVGCIVNTTVELGDSKLDSHPILAVTATSGTLSPYGFYSGHIGLAGDNVPLNKGPTIVSALYQSGQVPSGEVGLFLPRFDNTTQAEMTFGDPATSPHADNSKAVALQFVDDPPFKYGYVVEFDSFKIGDQEIAAKNRTFLNTASTGISFPASLGKAPCSPTIPDPYIVISFGGDQGQEFVVQYQDLVSRKADGSGECWAMVTPSKGVFAETWIMGSPLFHNVYHSVDTQSGTVKMFGMRQ
ncbi:hypothetical protein I317_01383 [Kwoniella heveanensis CBS 569]|nr:hypothetical protein I317_01383 [Kwoniella heveanensis CBS 569]